MRPLGRFAGRISDKRSLGLSMYAVSRAAPRADVDELAGNIESKAQKRFFCFVFVFLNKTKYLLSLCARYNSNDDDIVPAYVDCLQGYCVENPPYSSISPLLSCCCHILNTSVPRGVGVFPTPSNWVTPDSSPTIHSILILSTWSEGHITLVKG